MSNAMFMQMTAALPDCPTVTRTNHSIKSFDGSYINVAEFRQEGKPRGTKALYYIHGGGMILGSVDVFEKSIAKRCEETGLPIFAVAYRLAPENPHPTPVYDCWSGLQWLSSNAEQLGVDSSKIIVLGESAGGGLAGESTSISRTIAGTLVSRTLIISIMISLEVVQACR